MSTRPSTRTSGTAVGPVLGHRIISAIMCTSYLLSTTVHAANKWDGGAGIGNWSAVDNWDDNALPMQGDNQTITFAGIAQIFSIQDLADPFILNKLVFDNTAGAFLLGSNFKIQFKGTTPQLLNSGDSDKSISTPLDIPDGVSIEGAGSGKIVISRGISGNGALTKSNSFEIELDGSESNTYAGPTTVNEGTVKLSKNTGKIAIPGALNIGNGAGVDMVVLTKPHQIADGAVVTLAAAKGAILDLAGNEEQIGVLAGRGGEVKLGNATGKLLTGGSATLPFGGIISGKGNVVKNGDNVLVLTGAHTYTGTTTIERGTVTLKEGKLGATEKCGLITVKAQTIFNGKGSINSSHEVKAETGSIFNVRQSPALLLLSFAKVMA